MWGLSWRTQEENKPDSCPLKGSEAVTPGFLNRKLSLPKYQFSHLTGQRPLGEMADPTSGARKEQREPRDHLIFPGRTEVLKTDRDMWKRHRSWPDGALIGLSGDTGTSGTDRCIRYVCSQGAARQLRGRAAIAVQGPRFGFHAVRSPS